MKTIFEDEDLDAIAERVALKLRPLIAQKSHAAAADTVFDVPGLAAYLKVDESWVYKQVQMKNVPHFKLGKYTRFKKAAIDKWVAGATVTPISAFSVLTGKRG